jgi:hypothetical protein
METAPAVAESKASARRSFASDRAARWAERMHADLDRDAMLEQPSNEGVQFCFVIRASWGHLHHSRLAAAEGFVRLFGPVAQGCLSDY